MRIAVTTPTGHVGRHVLPMLVRAGVRPLALVRDPGRLDVALRDEIDTAVVDQFDPASVTAATTDVDALFWVDPVTGGPDPMREYTQAAAAVAGAVSDNRIRRVVFQSSVGAEKRQGAGEIDGLAQTEQALDATAADVLHLRCAYFFTNLELQLDAIRAGLLQVVLPIDQPMGWVAPRDIAEVAVTLLLAADWTGRSVQAVHGPADLSWRQAAQIVSAAIGRALRVEQIADDAMRELLAGAGLADTQIEALLGMSTGLRDGFVPEQARTVVTTTPTTLAAWAYDVLRPQL